MSYDIVEFLLLAPAILFALTVHEYAHAWAAYKLGDSTAKDLGRMTLNPIPHIDPIGLIMMFLVKFGWAKPVPVNFTNLRNPLKDMVLVAAAGPGINLIMGIIAALILRAAVNTNIIVSLISNNSIVLILFQMLGLFMYINFALAFFNLIPLHPLDGSRIVTGLLPYRYLVNYSQMEVYGPFVLFGLIIVSRMYNVPIFWYIIGKPVEMMISLFAGNTFV